jgi:hypothetical protein
MDNLFYTYAYLREDGTPYYIGKGKGYRAFHKDTHTIKPPTRERILFLKKNLTEEEAFKHEIYLIAVFGRKDKGTGILRNLTDGGDGVSNPSEETRKRMGGMRGKTHSEETKRKISKAQKGKQTWLGKKHREESKKKMRAVRKGKESFSGDNNPMFGRNHSKSAKEKMSVTKRERKIGVGRVWFHLPEENKERHFAPDALPSAPWVRGRLKRKRR